MKLAFSIFIVLSLVLITTTAVSAVTNTLTISSDTSVMVYGPLDTYTPLGNAAWGSPAPSVVALNPGPWPTLDSASWISNTVTTQGNITGDTWRLFRKTVNLGNGAINISGIINATSDNAEEVYVNGVLLGSDGEVQGPFVDDYEWSTIKAYPYQIAAANTLTFDFIVRNYAVPPTLTSNPTGLIFTATISFDCPNNIPTNTPTNTATNTATNTPTNTATNTPTFTATNTATATPNIAQKGCTPGYWKQSQHLDSWVATGYSPDQTLESVFDVPDNYGLDNYTLLQALSFQGGKSTTDAAGTLFRAAVAALLNSTHPTVGYPLTTAQIITKVNSALARNDRSTILDLATKLDKYNNLGCPLN